MSEKKFPPRRFINTYDEANVTSIMPAYLFHRIAGGETCYLSLEEHEALIAEARVNAHQELINGFLGDDYLTKLIENNLKQMDKIREAKAEAYEDAANIASDECWYCEGNTPSAIKEKAARLRNEKGAGEE